MDQPFTMTALAEAAASLHEMFTAFVEAGFTDEQALTLVAAVITSHVHGDA